MNIEKYKYIAIEGPIGVGKTSLAKLIAKKYNGELILEQYYDNPFLKEFYDDIEKNAFHTQVFFLINRYKQQISDIQEFSLFHSFIIADYTFYKDKIFAYMNLSDNDLLIYNKMYKAFEKDIISPDIIIYLYANMDVLSERIKKRNRDFEKNIKKDYLKSLIYSYDLFFKYFTLSKVVKIDTSDIDFVNSEEDRDFILDKVDNILNNTGLYYNLINS